MRFNPAVIARSEATKAAAMAGLAIIVTSFTVSRRGLLPGLAAAVVFGVAAALLIAAVRSFG